MGVQVELARRLEDIREDFVLRARSRAKEIANNPLKSGPIISVGILSNVASIPLAISEVLDVHVTQIATKSGEVIFQMSGENFLPAIVAGFLGLATTAAGIALDRSNYRKSAQGFKSDIEQVMGTSALDS